MTATDDSTTSGVVRIPKSIEHYAELKENRFFFELEGSKPDTFVTHSIPKLSYISPISKAGRRLAAVAEDPDADVATAMKEIVALIDTKVGAAVGKLKDDQLYWLQGEWVAASGKKSLPESSASSRSSSSTKRPSKRTSSTKAPASAESESTTSPSAT